MGQTRVKDTRADTAFVDGKPVCMQGVHFFNHIGAVLKDVSAQDSMISHTEVLENGPSKQRCQVVRWIRQFPFVFISKREYVIARRVFKQHGCIYGITKVHLP